MRNIKGIDQFLNESAAPVSLSAAIKSKDIKAIKAAISALVEKICDEHDDGPVKFSIKFDKNEGDSVNFAARVKSDFNPDVIAKKFAKESKVFSAQEHETSNRRLTRWVCDLKPSVEAANDIEFLSVYFQ